MRKARRETLSGRATLAGVAAAGLLAVLANVAHAQAQLRVTASVRADQPGPTLHRNLYGQFAEHLGRGIYEGIWVGEDSEIPNTRGYRNDVLEALRALQVPVVRWPGGCFADEYHWQDGIGPRDERPVRVNTSWGGVEESNAFGTHEFMDFAETIGAAAYVAGNVGTGSPTEMAQWAEYITSDSQSTLAKLRRTNGRDKPWKLPYVGIGNETWGCGGQMRAEYFADVYRQFATFLDTPESNRAEKLASGPYGDDYHWTEVLLSQASKHMDAYTLHYYTLPGDWDKKGAATDFTEDEWAVTIVKALLLDEYVAKHSAIMDKYDPEKRIGLYMDEWGTWYDPEPGHNGAFLYQQNTVRDAVTAASTLNILHRHADRVRMSMIAQMVNVLQAMILTDGQRMLRTPTYHVYRMHIPFQDATFLPVETASPAYTRGEWSFAAVDVAAARGEDGKVYLSLVNRDPNRAATLEVAVDGARARNAEGEVLTGPRMDSHNTFDKPDAIVPAKLDARVANGKLRVELPAKSVAVVALGE